MVQAIESVRRLPEENVGCLEDGVCMVSWSDAEMVRLTESCRGLKNRGPEIRLARALITAKACLI